MASNKSPEAHGAYHFEVTFPGPGGSARFRSASGLKVEWEVVTMREGGMSDFEHKLMGGAKYGNVVLKQGFADSKLSATLLKAASGGRKPTRYDKAISIAQLGPGGKTIAKWYLIEAWVCKWEGPEFDATKNEISIETIEIAHHGIEVG